MKSKREVCEELIKQGIEAEVENGILWIYGMKSRRKVSQMLHQMEYDATFGMRREKVKAKDV